MLNLGFPHLLLLMLMSRLGGPVRVVTPPASCLFMVCVRVDLVNLEKLTVDLVLVSYDRGKGKVFDGLGQGLE
ncbi:hypothetical protein FOXYSP1_08964 [Fusarium oxysporum f. sp. phaseoli]|jgi:hypothetical protein